MERQNYCGNCGTKTQEIDRFCAKCGTQLGSFEKNIKTKLKKSVKTIHSHITEPKSKTRTYIAIGIGIVILIGLIWAIRGVSITGAFIFAGPAKLVWSYDKSGSCDDSLLIRGCDYVFKATIRNVGGSSADNVIFSCSNQEDSSSRNLGTIRPGQTETSSILLSWTQTTFSSVKPGSCMLTYYNKKGEMIRLR